MPERVKIYLFLICAALIACSTPSETTNDSDRELTGDRDLHGEVTELIVQMPVDRPDEQRWLNEQLLNTGPDGIRVLAGMLTPAGSGDDTYARLAISSLAEYVSRPGAEEEREKFEEALLNELRRDHSGDARRFMIDQLERPGSDRSVPLMEEFLRQDRLFEPALRLLVSLDSAESARAVRQGLVHAEGDRKLALVKALGDLQDGGAASEIRRLADSDEWSEQSAALYALSEIGNPGDSDRFRSLVESPESGREVAIYSFAIRYSNRLTEQGYDEESSGLNRLLLDENVPVQFRVSALTLQAYIEGEELIDELIGYANDPNEQVRAVALDQLNRLQGQAVRQAMEEALDDADSHARMDLVRALGRRGDSASVDILRQRLDDTTFEVRTASAQAILDVGGSLTAEEGLSLLEQAGSDEERESVVGILLQLPTDNLVERVAGSLSEADDTHKPHLLRILRERHAESHLNLIAGYVDHDLEDVRIEAIDAFGQFGSPSDLEQLMTRLGGQPDREEVARIQQALISILNRVDSSRDRDRYLEELFAGVEERSRPEILQLVPSIDGASPALVREAARSSVPAVREAALLALAEWREPDAMPDLLAVIPEATESTREYLFRGYIRLMLLSGASAADRAGKLGELADLVRSSDELVRVVRMFPDATEDLAALLDEPARSRYLESFDQEEPEEAEPDKEPAWGELFNGENLDGWEAVGQNPDSWGVEEGLLYTDGAGSGWLSTVDQYDDFVMELEFRVPEAGNSGVFVRAPREGNPAFEGFEIQILDDYADDYADLEPYQYSGSIYNVKAPSARVTKPAGEWQSMKIRAEGPRIQVHINGELILNTSLVHHMDLLDGHPGLVRRSGYVGLQNHTSRVDFRHIRIEPVR